VHLWYFTPWLSRNKNRYIEEVYRALIDNSSALNNIDKAPCLYSRCTIYRRMVYIHPWT